MNAQSIHDLLLQGAEAFNAWREDNLDAPIDLKGRDLRGLNLRGALLAGAELDGCQFDDAALSNASFCGASLQGATFNRADLRGAVFGPAQLFNAKLIGSKLGDALSHAADLGGASLQGARLDEANLIECDLTDANLSEANIKDANLKRACLEGAIQSPPPEDPEDFDEVCEWLLREPDAARGGFIMFAALTAQLGGSDPEDIAVVTALATKLGYDQEGFNACLPSGPTRLTDLKIEPLKSHWLRRLLFDFICHLGAPQNDCVNAIAHFGAQWGFSEPAMMRIIGEALDVTLS